MATENTVANLGFPARLELLRKEKKLTQRKLAELVSVHYTHIGRYERGQSKPSTGTLRRLADVLGVTSDFLIEGTTDDVARERLHDRDLLRQFQLLEKLPDERRSIVKELIESFIVREQMKQMVA